MDNIQEIKVTPEVTVSPDGIQIANEDGSGASLNHAPLTPIIAAEPKVQGKAMTMDFPDAIREVIKGKKVARAEWGNFDYVFLKDEWLMIFTKDKLHTLLVSQGDLEGQDWVIVNETN